jgi:SAM-dependent methyltransferase
MDSEPAGMREPRDSGIYTGTALSALQAAQSRALLPALQRCAGSHGLLVSAGAGQLPPALPLLSHWTQLLVSGPRYVGDIIAATDEPLAFVDDAFDLVWLCHVLEVVDDFSAVLLEAVRVLAAGGTLVITGIHPISAWAPWYYWQECGAGHGLRTPSRLARELRRSGLRVTGMQRVGSVWPRRGAPVFAAPYPVGGGYVLLAQKQCSLVTPLRLRTEPLHLPANGRLSPSAQRKLTA